MFFFSKLAVIAFSTANFFTIKNESKAFGWSKSRRTSKVDSSSSSSSMRKDEVAKRDLEAFTPHWERQKLNGRLKNDINTH